MCYHPPPMGETRSDLYHGVFEWCLSGGSAAVSPRTVPPPVSIPDPLTGRKLHISTIQAGTPAICPVCSCHARGGFVSFEDDLRIAYACPTCKELVWIRGA